MPTYESKRIFCNSCHKVTKHKCAGEHTKEEAYEEGDPPDTMELMDISIYRLWICANCGEGTLEEIEGYAISPEADVEELQDGFFDPPEYYPERFNTQKIPKIFNHIPKKLETIYQETLHAYNRELNILCAIGIRTLVEGIADGKGIKVKNDLELI